MGMAVFQQNFYKLARKLDVLAEHSCHDPDHALPIMNECDNSKPTSSPICHSGTKATLEKDNDYQLFEGNSY